MAEHHHDHSNCNHDHHDNSAKKASEVVNGELTARQKAAEKLNKALLGLHELANEHKKSLPKPATGAVNKADVDLLIKELQLSKADAESALRTNGGDVIVTLKKLIEC
ncbi:hypothetical protein G6F57_004482 [Rhizopus arrhizus]|uniref:Nascent polypeptide-associated complex subunit alpha-like UBA domain-containing protein n=1 Tax=Rhizopus oryzae TaxID=64495 RepID=A0A9P6X6V4_RHIOR|nr:hypothetical protein G6F23_003562 [Rhizopus arrhizus]KAG1421090.1 hypothetical protein G6F58_003901 [Rhizopus delemar]KAG0761593.1 hypothetical protein G6F24_007439 [Rhizopus arrhizus]KAG0790608.1 hypothetical protein G6F21_005689 [Rhizopus arrhizus]KAG0797145.1 hypothetical protein G6F22_004761 [Rhizopus arrhizus]